MLTQSNHNNNDRFAISKFQAIKWYKKIPKILNLTKSPNFSTKTIKLFHVNR